MKKILFFLIIVLMTLVAVHQDVYAQGTGTASDPFLINSKADLEAFRTGVNSGNKFYYTPSNTFSTTNVSGSTEIPAGGRDRYFKLAVDIELNSGNVAGCDGVKDLSWENWTPIGTQNKPFYGHFDGGFHIVSGMFLDRVSASSQFGGTAPRCAISVL